MEDRESAGGKKVTFKVDTGAEATAISEDTYKDLGTITLTHPQRSLRGPASQPLQVIGQFLGELTYRDVTTRQTIYVMKTLHSNLLGLPAIEALKIATLNIHTIDDDSNQEDSLVKKSVRDKFPSLFQGLGNLGEPYTITLCSDAKPHSLFTARKIHYLYAMQ